MLEPISITTWLSQRLRPPSPRQVPRPIRHVPGSPPKRGAVRPAIAGVASSRFSPQLCKNVSIDVANNKLMRFGRWETR